MSRIGKKPVLIPDGVVVSVKDGWLSVKGPKGDLKQSIPPQVQVQVDKTQVIVLPGPNQKRGSAYQGLVRALLHNMVEGVSKGYTKALDMVGVGYRAALEGKTLILNVGYTKPLRYPLPPTIQAELLAKDTQIILRSADKELLGQTAARIRSLRLPEPYRGKGIKYVGEKIRQKAGKTAGK